MNIQMHNMCQTDMLRYIVKYVLDGHNFELIYPVRANLLCCTRRGLICLEAAVRWDSDIIYNGALPYLPSTHHSSHHSPLLAHRF